MIKNNNNNKGIKHFATHSLKNSLNTPKKKNHFQDRIHTKQLITNPYMYQYKQEI